MRGPWGQIDFPLGLRPSGKSDYTWELPRATFGLPTVCTTLHTTQTVNFTKVFALSLEEHLWGSVPCEGGPKTVLQELEVNTTTEVLEDSHWTCLPSTPPALVNKSVENPTTPRCWHFSRIGTYRTNMFALRKGKV